MALTKTPIAWTDLTWNPVVGCSRVSAGCQACYAERLAATRLKHTAAYRDLARFRDNGEPQWTGDVRLLPERLADPLRHRKPARIFVCDMGDLFHEGVPDAYIDQVFAVMALAGGHSFQVLTKRPKRMVKYLAGLAHGYERLEAAARAMGWTLKCNGQPLLAWPVPNVWLGVSVENQAAADERIPLLLQTPAAVRFLSIEPLLEDLGEIDLTGIGWCIVGSESGPRARPMSEDWVRSIRDQCVKAGVPLFLKQTMRNGKRVPMPALDGQMWAQFPEAVHGR